MEEPSPLKPLSDRAKIITWWGTIVAIIAVVVFGSVFVTLSYRNRQVYEMENWRPPFVGKVETDMFFTNRTGETVRLEQLKDRVYLTGYQYTDCPVGCLGMAAIMKDLYETFHSEHEEFGLVSISVNPAGDTPEKMNEWVKRQGLDTEDWWFLTGDPERIASYMLSEFKFFATERNTDPAVIATQGEFAHDQRIALVDGGANIRGYYDVLNPQRGELEIARLERDLKLVLNPDLSLSDVMPEPNTRK